MGVEYTETMAGPEEQDRGKTLQALADGGVWVFLTGDFDLDGGIRLKLEIDDRLDSDSVRALLHKTLAALP